MITLTLKLAGSPFRPRRSHAPGLLEQAERYAQQRRRRDNGQGMLSYVCAL